MRGSQQTDDSKTTADVASGEEEVCRGALAARARRPKTRGGRSRNGEIDDGKHRIICDHIFVAHRRACERAAGKLSTYHFAARDWNLTMPAAVDTMSHFTSVFRSSRFIERSFKKSKSFMLPKAASCLRAGTATMYSEESCEPSVRLAWNNK